MGVFGSEAIGHIVVMSRTHGMVDRRTGRAFPRNVRFLTPKQIPPSQSAAVDFIVPISPSAQPCIASRASFTPRFGTKAQLLAPDVAPTVVSKLEQLATRRTAMRAALMHLSFAPETHFASRAQSRVGRFFFSAVDFVLFGAGLIIGLASLCLLYPLYRCVWAYNEVRRLQAGIESLKLGFELATRIEREPELTRAQANCYLDIFRAQACNPRLFTTQFQTKWGELVDRELRYALDERVADFFCTSAAEDARRNKLALFARGAMFAIATSPPSLRVDDDAQGLASYPPLENFLLLMPYRA